MSITGPKPKINLNTSPVRERQPFAKKDHKNFHYRGRFKIRGQVDDTQECVACTRALPLTAFTTKYLRADGAWVLRRTCRDCEVRLNAERNAVHKIAPPKPNKCDCCHHDRVLQMDHLHGTTLFRGWICNQDNAGIGLLGDTLEGVLRGAFYLEPDINKIIETLHKIKNDHLE